MLKILVFSISCVLFLSGCKSEKKADHEARNARILAAAKKKQAELERARAANGNAESGGATGTAADTRSGNSNQTTTPITTDTNSAAAKGETNTGTATGVTSSNSSGTQTTSVKGSTSATQTGTQANSAIETMPAPVAPTSQEGTNATQASGAAKSATQTPAAQGASASQAQNPTPTNQSENSGDEEEGDLVKLTFEETKNLELLLRTQLSETTYQALQIPVVPQNINGEDLRITTEGNYEKFTLAVLNQDADLIRFKDIQLQLSTQTKVRSGDYTLVGTCVGAKCEVVFIAIYKIADKKLVENYPIVLKWVNDKYLTALRMEGKEIEEALKKEGVANQTREEQISKAPPQVRVRYMLDDNVQKHFTSLTQRLNTRMQKDNAIYSGRFFVNIKSGSFDWILKSVAEGLNLALKIDFTTDNTPSVEFKGVVPEKGARLTDKSGITLDVYHVIKDQFFLMVFENTKFESVLPDSKKALQAYLCQVLVENNETFSECEPMPSAYVLGEWALEGRIGGPVFVNTGTDGKPIFKEKYTPIPVEDMIKASRREQ